MTGQDVPAWRRTLREQEPSLFDGIPSPASDVTYRVLTYEVTGRIARITFNRPEHGNAITADTPVELAHAVERADLDPRVHVICLSGRGTGFCGGYDLSIFAERGFDSTTVPAAATSTQSTDGTLLDGRVQARNHDPSVSVVIATPRSTGVSPACCTRTSRPWRSCTASA